VSKPPRLQARIVREALRLDERYGVITDDLPPRGKPRPRPTGVTR
jgi:hypothetical protein